MPLLPPVGSMSTGDETAPSRRRSLAALMQRSASQLQELRKAFHIVQVSTRRRELGRHGHSQTKKLVTLELLSKYRLDGTMTLMIAKLLLPKRIWDVCAVEAGPTQAEHLRTLMTHPKIIRQANKIWRRRAMVTSMRTLSRVKRLVAEYQVYQELLIMNQRGVTPKKTDLLSWLNKFWVRSGDASDALLGRLAAREKSVTKWMRRFRVFWHISFGKLPLHTEMTPELQGIKVVAVVHFCFRKWFENWYHFVDLIRVPSITKYIRSNQNMIPILEPDLVTNNPATKDIPFQRLRVS